MVGGRRGTMIGAAAVLGVAAVLAGGVPAEAAVTQYVSTTRWIGGGASVNVRSATSTTARIVRSIPVGTPLAIDCQTVGGRLGFSRYADNRTWDRLTDGTYIHDVVTTAPGGAPTTLPDGGYVAWSAGIPRCGVQQPAAPSGAATGAAGVPDSRVASAIAWATSQTTATGWAGRCESFVEAAYGARTNHFYSAWTDYRAQLAAGRIHPSDVNAPAGAIVYYEYTDPTTGERLGHVALSIGGGQAIGTYGAFGSSKLPAQHAVNGRNLTYLGWAPVPTGW